ncbi:TonB family protein [Chitinophaga sp. YIM B06452]|uniref:TonB family protein n=1 Tax=Chitinophaga sp. YIM B06452 TaxID=3082158 RepID=UPI0031FEE4C7
MKQFILLLFILTATRATAQPLNPKPAAMAEFSKAMLKEYRRDKPEFKEKLSILLQEPGKPFDLRQILEEAGKDSAIFAAVLDATFRMNGGRETQRIHMASIGLSLTRTEELTEYAMYLFARKTNGDKPNPRYPAGFTYGAKRFRNAADNWYYIVILENGKIELKLYAGPQNKLVKDKEKAQEIIRGTLAGNKVITEEPRYKNKYYFVDGVLGERNLLGAFLEFFDSTPEGEFTAGQPHSVFEGINSDDLIIATGGFEKTPPQPTDTAGIHYFTGPAPTFSGPNDSLPSFPGEDAALSRYLSKNLRYPTEAGKKGIGGTVYVSFIVTAEGKITNVKTVGARKGYGLDEEAIRIIKKMPDWKPGISDGKPVPVLFNLPVRFEPR